MNDIKNFHSPEQYEKLRQMRKEMRGKHSHKGHDEVK